MRGALGGGRSEHGAAAVLSFAQIQCVFRDIFFILFLHAMAETVAASTSKDAVVVISLVGPRSHLEPLLAQATVYSPTVAHLLKQIYLTGEAWGSRNWLQGW